MSNPFAVAQRYLDNQEGQGASPEVVEDKTIQTTTPESLAVSVLAETEPDEVGKILGIWKETFGLELDRERVVERLENLKRWQARWLSAG